MVINFLKTKFEGAYLTGETLLGVERTGLKRGLGDDPGLGLGKHFTVLYLAGVSPKKGVGAPFGVNLAQGNEHLVKGPPLTKGLLSLSFGGGIGVP